ncbi:Ribosomal large subunit pseudouridine synthase D [hydrothermal vent metagenome]|uniref:Ribosomal large subunit pseudouridine synthase D n=1 Tax=hydrothermal vent metagenome TaxID=652676 RepID=A0A1W1BMJ7_9ZZZZ
MNELFVHIPNSLKGERIDFALATLLNEFSRSKITTWIKKNRIQLNGKVVKPKDKVVGEEILSVLIEKDIHSEWLAEDIPLNIIYEDEDILVINKPAGLVTHPGSGNGSGTLANALLYYDTNLKFIDRAGIVHRLDKDTSGLLVVAKNEKSRQSLITQLQNHTVHREYLAIVYGHMISGGTIDEPIGRDGRDRTKQTIKENGKQAITHIRVVERFENHSLVKAVLETGRTHQIRVHLSAIGYPLVGDIIYGGKVHFPKGADEKLKESLKYFRRQALHAKKLTIIHPTTEKEMSWKVDMPEDMQKLLKILEEYDI